MPCFAYICQVFEVVVCKKPGFAYICQFLEGFVCKKPGFAYTGRGFEEDGAGPATTGSDLYLFARNGR